MGNPDYTKILLGIDGSTYSIAAKEYACEIAARQIPLVLVSQLLIYHGIQSSSGLVPLGGHIMKYNEKSIC